MSTLIQIREKVAELSGRYDLVTDYGAGTFTDAGADFFIKGAQDYLDRITETSHDRGEVTLALAQGAFTVSLPNMRAIERVRLVGSDDTQVYLTKVPIRDLREEYGSEAGFATLDQSAPAYYALFSLRTPTPTATSETNKALLILPPPDADVDIVVEGLFSSEPLDADGDESFWSLVHPDLLVLATLYKLEVFYRNTTGANDYRVALHDHVMSIGLDLTAEQAAENRVMQNSW